MESHSNFKEEHYGRVFEYFDTHSNHTETIATVVEQVIKSTGKAPTSLLDIGAGTGRLTKRVAKHVTGNIVALEPNKSYIGDTQGLHIVHQRFLEWQQQTKYDLILCSHVLYHVPRSKWPAFLNKLLSLKSANAEARAVIVMVAPRGPFHELQSFINPDYQNSERVLDVLKCQTQEIEIVPISTSFSTPSRDDFAMLVRMFALDNSFSKVAFKALPVQRQSEIETAINKFVNACLVSHPGGNTHYCLTTQDDILVT
jgi:hypothetical protein